MGGEPTRAVLGRQNSGRAGKDLETTTATTTTMGLSSRMLFGLVKKLQMEEVDMIDTHER
jgi:hypothetical protein